jgi:acetyl esterase/lipase
MNVEAWDALLGPGRRVDDNVGSDVSMYASPSRCEDLSGLPPAFIDVGSCDMFRDENVQYASKLWRDGTQCELHVWPGGFHNFDVLCPSVDISMAAREAEINWLQRLLSSVDE